MIKVALHFVNYVTFRRIDQLRLYCLKNGMQISIIQKHFSCIY